MKTHDLEASLYSLRATPCVHVDSLPEMFCLCFASGLCSSISVGPVTPG